MKQPTIDYFASLDIPVLNFYGMSETCAGGSMQANDRINLKAAGQASLGSELVIENPDEKGIGEIVFRGRHVMMGYFKNEQATKETID
jgi:long-subunit acyl-CoA synthetase (AMP-forming)